MQICWVLCWGLCAEILSDGQDMIWFFLHWAGWGFLVRLAVSLRTQRAVVVQQSFKHHMDRYKDNEIKARGM